MKVRYIGYSSDCDEWRSRNDIVQLNDGESSSSSDESDGADLSQLPSKSFKPFCLYEELASRIKSLLVSSRKADPLCRVNMGFDTVYFEGLIRRSLTPKRSSRRQVYTVPILSRLDDILGHRWYIRGINTAGDFCYVTPDTVKFYLKHCKCKIEYQMQDDGTLMKSWYDQGLYHLTFQFIRGDGTCSQWSSVLKSCQSPSR